MPERDAPERAGEETSPLTDRRLCGDCADELFDAADRRHRYAFTGCRECGPRWSLLRRPALTRAHTAFADLEPCPACAAERDGGGGRREGWSIVSCPACGPRARSRNRGGVADLSADPAALAVAALQSGSSVAVRGLGGWSVWSPLDRVAPEARPTTAVVCADRAALDALGTPSELESLALDAPGAPLVRLRRWHRGGHVPGWLGVRLAATPFEHLVLRELTGAVACSSGPAGESPCIDDDEALGRFADAELFVSWDLPIVRPVRDTVVQEVRGRLCTVRVGFGSLPLELERAPTGGSPVLALGSQRDPAAAASRDSRIWLAGPAGDPDEIAALRLLRSTIDDLRALAGEPLRLLIEAHPDSSAAREVESLGRPVLRCQHHVAHIDACRIEHGVDEPVLGVAFDDGGLGTDGAWWGGEFLRVGPDTVERIAHLRGFRLPGGVTAAATEPRRAALGALHAFLGDKVFAIDWLAPVASCEPEERERFAAMLRAGFHAPWTTAVGCLFDAAVSLMGLVQVGATPKEGIRRMDALALGVRERAAYPLLVREEADTLIVDWEPALRELVRDVHRHVAPGRIAARLHNGLVEAVTEVARRSGETRVALGGDAFVDRDLAERAAARLEAEGFRVLLSERVPCNDGGLAVGQLARALRSVAASPEA